MIACNIWNGTGVDQDMERTNTLVRLVGQNGIVKWNVIYYSIETVFLRAMR